MRCRSLLLWKSNYMRWVLLLLRSAVLLLVLGVPSVFGGAANAQSAASPSSPKQHVLHLNGSNTGQRVAATTGQPIEITLQTVGPGAYDSPQISSPAIRFEGVEFPKMVIPAGPTQIYRFRAASEGEAQVKIPHILRVKHSNAEVIDPTPTFAVTIRVYQQRKP